MEAEALMLGIWRNVEELETYISLSELEAIIREAREKEARHHKFLAAIQGIDLDNANVDHEEDRVEAAKRRLAARQEGKSEVEADYAVLDLDYEVEQ